MGGGCLGSVCPTFCGLEPSKKVGFSGSRGWRSDPSATKWFFVQQAVTRLVPWLLTVMNHFTGSPKQQGLKNYTSGCHRTSPRSLPEPAGACRSSHPEFLVSQDFGESAVAKRVWHIGPSLWRARKFTLW